MPWEHLTRVFGTPGEPEHCWCQWFRTRGQGWREVAPEARAQALREQTGAGGRPSGLVAYVEDEPAGWVAVAPRGEHARLVEALGDAAGEDHGAEIWSITCFVVRPGYQGLGITGALLDRAVEWAREHGAGAVEGYVRVLERQTGQRRVRADERWGAEHQHGASDLLAEAGFVEVDEPGLRRVLRLRL